MRGVLTMVLLLSSALAGCMSDEDRVADTANVMSFAGTDGSPVGVTTESDAWTDWHSTGYRGAEPNMGITSEGNLFVSAFDKTIRSTDGGVTWETVHNYNPIQGLVERGTSDPMLWVDPQTSRIFVNHMISVQCFTMLWSDDEGENWFQRDMACNTLGVDHQKVASGPYGPDAPVTRARFQDPVDQTFPEELADERQTVCETAPDPPVIGDPSCDAPGNPSFFNPVYPSAVYLCYQKVAAVFVTAAAPGTEVCLVSYDGGLTYPVESPVFNNFAHGCGGASGHPAVSLDGKVALANGWNCGPLVAVSTDSGITWTVNQGPTEWGSGASIDPDLAWDDAGNLYLMWRDASHMTRVARSSDDGATWDAVWNITAPGVTSTRFHVMSAGAEGRIAMAYLGTDYGRNEGTGRWADWNGAPGNAPENATWNLYIVTSEDAHMDDATFTVHQVTDDGDPVQKGCLWEGGGGGGERRCRNLLDFIDSAVAPDGTFYVAYADGCTYGSECAGNVTDELPELKSRDRHVAVAALHGWSLYGPLEAEEGTTARAAP